MRKEATILRAVYHQFIVCPLGNEPSVLEKQHSISLTNLRKSMRDKKGSASFLHALDSSLNIVLSRAIDGTSSVVENQDARIDQECTRDSEALSLTARKRHPTFTNFRFVARRKLLDEIVCLRVLSSRLDHRSFYILSQTIRNVFHDAS